MLLPPINANSTRLSASGRDTVAGLLTRQARERGGSLFLVFEESGGRVREVTYAEQVARAGRMAALLRRLGVNRGDTFHVHLANCPEFYDCWFGGALLGAVMVPTNPLSTADELAYILTQAECRVSVTTADLLPAVVGARDGGAPVVHILLARSEEAHTGTLQLSRELAGCEPRALDAAVGPAHVAGMLYTSGTTSRPKGVLVTNANYLHVGEVVAQHLRVRPDDRLFICLPLFHGNAQYYSTMGALVSGATVVLADRFSASAWAKQVARHHATIASLFAAPMRMLLAQPADPADAVNDLRVTLFAQNLSEEQAGEFERRFGAPLLQLYGMTETIAPPTMNPLYGERRHQSIGRPVLGANLRIVDGEGRDVPAGEVGQLLVEGEPGRTLMAGYFKNPEATAEALRDGWLATGDNMRADEDGYLSFVDRGKDMIKRAGENVATSEVERVVNEHPAVFESAAIGVPDPIRDEAIKVFVVLHEGAQAGDQEIIAWCAARLAKFKVPSEIELVAELPRTSVGKIQKHLLRAAEQERLSR